MPQDLFILFCVAWQTEVIWFGSLVPLSLWSTELFPLSPEPGLHTVPLHTSRLIVLLYMQPSGKASQQCLMWFVVTDFFSFYCSFDVHGGHAHCFLPLFHTSLKLIYLQKSPPLYVRADGTWWKHWGGGILKKTSGILVFPRTVTYTFYIFGNLQYEVHGFSVYE